MLPPGVANQSEIAAAVADAERKFAPDVVHIRYKVERDWSGDWAVFFRILLSDEASAVPYLYKIAAQVREYLPELLDFDALGLLAYYSFRGQSEQAKLRDPVWA